jgi:hypothetical protein
MPDDRSRPRPFTPQRPRAGGGPAPYSRGSGPSTPYAPRPSPGPPTPRPASEPAHSVRLRDGEREVEVTGSAGFVRQILDDLPALLGRMRQEPSSRLAAISMPPPPPPPSPAAVSPARPAETSPRPAETSPRPAETQQVAPLSNGHAPVDDLTGQVLDILRSAGRPIGIAEIRRQLSDDISGQQVRRVLERASDQVANTGGRPAEYRLR